MRCRPAIVLAAVAVVGWAGCKKQESEPAPVPGPGLQISAGELKRGVDACGAYVAAVCSCAETVPALEKQCALAKALPSALRVATEVGQSATATKLDSLHAADSLRKTVAECIEQISKLPARGCAVQGR